jgi:dephospho-CoA kinase
MDGLGLKRIGLTGGIGSGKSTVARCLVELGALLVDADVIARELTAPGGAALPALAAEFGADLMTAEGALDRERMRALAFGDRGAKLRLEAVLHPLIGAETQRRAAQAGERSVVFDIPLLTESRHWRARVERVLVVDCHRATQIERVMQRSGWSAEAVQRVIEQQAPRAQRRAAADAVIFNDGLSLEQLKQQVGSLWRLWNNPPQ